MKQLALWDDEDERATELWERFSDQARAEIVAQLVRLVVEAIVVPRQALEKGSKDEGAGKATGA